MNELIEKYAMQCTSWPFYRDMVNEGDAPSAIITEWPSHVTEEQKAFWRNFVSNLVDDLKKDMTVVNTNKLDEILSLLNK